MSSWYLLSTAKTPYAVASVSLRNFECFAGNKSVGNSDKANVLCVYCPGQFGRTTVFSDIGPATDKAEPRQKEFGTKSRNCFEI